jgi:hypothetical protein
LSGVHKISITLQRYQLESTSKDIVWNGRISHAKLIM